VDQTLERVLRLAAVGVDPDDVLEFLQAVGAARMDRAVVWLIHVEELVAFGGAPLAIREYLYSLTPLTWVTPLASDIVFLPETRIRRSYARLPLTAVKRPADRRQNIDNYRRPAWAVGEMRPPTLDAMRGSSFSAVSPRTAARSASQSALVLPSCSRLPIARSRRRYGKSVPKRTRSIPTTDRRSCRTGSRQDSAVSQ
jgi:hypothetical protein